MKIFIDTEFIEFPNSIELISIGMVTEEKEFYAEFSDFKADHVSQWVIDNVYSGLKYYPNAYPTRIEDKKLISLYSTKKVISDEIKAFIGNETPEFYGYYPAYDWVAFCWLFGTMVDLPENWPIFCHCLHQLALIKNTPEFNYKGKNQHNALADARWNKKYYEFIMKGENS